jgi:serine/threonine protein kinase
MFLDPITFSTYIENFISWKELFTHIPLLFLDKIDSGMIELKGARHLGSGSSGEVMEYDSDSGKYAVKFFYSKNLLQFELEIAGYKKIEGKIPSLKLVSYNQQNMILVLSPVSSNSFSERRIVDLEDFLILVDDLMVMRELGIIHRDVRPENLMYIPYGRETRLVLIDWSCSTSSKDPVPFQGTVHYASDRLLFDLSGVLNKTCTFYTSDDLSSLVKVFLAVMTGFDQILKKTPAHFAVVNRTWENMYKEKPWTLDLIEAAKNENYKRVKSLMISIYKAPTFILVFFFCFFLKRKIIYIYIFIKFKFYYIFSLA